MRRGYDGAMGFLHDRFMVSTKETSIDRHEIASHPNVERGSATRIRIKDGIPVYGYELPIELGFWAREIPAGKVFRRWSHRWYRLELRYDAPHRLRRRETSAMDEATLAADIEACARARAMVDASPTSKARTELSRCLTDQGKTLVALGRLDVASDALAEAVTLLRGLVDREPRQTATLWHALDIWAQTLADLGRHAEADVLQRELVERGTMVPVVDSLIVAEVPLAGRRRCDRAVLRPGLHDRKREAFGPEGKLAEVVTKEIENAKRTLAAGCDPLLEIDVAQIVLSALENHEIVRKDPFTTNDDVLIAGISIPRPPFHAPEYDYTPKWNEDESARTGWVIGVCADAESVHRQVLVALDPMIRAALDGTLRIHPPANERGSSITFDSQRLGGSVQELAEGAAWQAMAGVPEPTKVLGKPVASVAKGRLNDLLYNLDRKEFRRREAASKVAASQAATSTMLTGRPVEDEFEAVFRDPLNEQRRKVEAFIEVHRHEPWARAGRRLLAKCTPHAARHPREKNVIKAEFHEYRTTYARELRAKDVSDFVTRWLEEEPHRASESTARLKAVRRRDPPPA